MSETNLKNTQAVTTHNIDNRRIGNIIAKFFDCSGNPVISPVFFVT